MKNYICLVSDGKKISISSALPEGVSVVGDQWMFRSFGLRLGEAISVYTDSIWIGAICVYDADAPDTASRIARHAFEHTSALVSRRLQSRLVPIFGDEAVQELWDHRYASPRQPAREYTPKGKMHAEVVDALSDICFRGK